MHILLKFRSMIYIFKKYSSIFFPYFLKRSHFLLLFVPFLTYWTILSLYTPKPFRIVLPVVCNSEGVCQIKKDESSINVVNADIQNQIKNTNLMDKILFPFSSIIYFFPRAINQTTFMISVSEPNQNLLQKAFVQCQISPQSLVELSYGSAIIFDKTTLNNVPDTLNSVADTLINCFRGVSSPLYNKVIVSPNGFISMHDVRIDFSVEFISTLTSKLFVSVEVFIIFTGLLTLIATFVKFLRQGWRYFTE